MLLICRTGIYHIKQAVHAVDWHSSLCKYSWNITLLLSLPVSNAKNRSKFQAHLTLSYGQKIEIIKTSELLSTPHNLAAN